MTIGGAGSGSGSPMKGHEQQEAALIDALAGSRMPHAWLLAGPQGVGKSHFAKRAASFIIADGDIKVAAGAHHLELSADDAVARLIKAGAHPELLWLARELPEGKRPKDGGPGKPEDIARNITIAQVRSLLARLRVRPANSRWRVVVVDSVDDMERGSANALLKTLEEPPASTIFLLISHMPGRLLPTIRSRCRLLRFQPLEDDVMAALLRQNLPEAVDREIDALVRIGQGAPGKALSYGALGLAAIEDQLRIIAESGDKDNRLRAELSKAMALAAEKPRFEAMLSLSAALAAEYARTARGDALGRALAVRDEVIEIARFAISSSEDAATVTFNVAGALAGLATPG